ncbi:hypothetical protein B0J13DRAFT_626555 [Dactylonectria estremocensis]|uniref:Uncharacterized protein n=1 Tax=Dactylonectria estremocensis TaxID=1079267 RepID=A0A9P9ISB1_9HYPO|nr:hypothetical protein B0J13DRAFT_626555 [Dactylonectria estremocensis]
MSGSHAAGTPLSSVTDYKVLVDNLARDFPRFKSLQSFLNLQKTRTSNIKRIDFPDSGRLVEADVRTVHEDDLSAAINLHDSARRLFIVENLSPCTVRTLGDCLKISPEFFLDYIDAIPSDFVITEGSKNRMKEQDTERHDVVPKPWYRHEKVDGHLPMLASLKPNNDHINIQYIGPREYEGSSDHRPRERMQPDVSKMNVARIAGLHFPIKLDPDGKTRFDNVAMTRHTAAVWFKPPTDLSQPEWTTGIILLDPPFEVQAEDAYGKRNQSVYRPFSEPMIFQSRGKNMDRRTTYMDSLVLYMLQNSGFKEEWAYHPFCIIEGISRIIASEWIAVSTYIERDLNSIEWRLESSRDRIEIHEKFLNQLFTLRRRIGKFKALVQDELQLFKAQAPRSWMSTPQANVAECIAGMQEDLKQAHSLLEKNSVRVSEAIELIAAIIQVREGEHSTTQNERLGFLTILATTALPFSTAASILGMQTKYGPPDGQTDGKGSWVDFWKYSGILLGAFWGFFSLYCVLSRWYRSVAARQALNSQ